MLTKRMLAVLVLLALPGGIAAYVLFWTPQNGPQDKTVIIPSGSGILKIAAILKADSILQNVWSFRAAARLLGYERTLKAGKYLIPSGANNLTILRILHSGKPYQELVTIPEGLPAKRIASILSRKVRVDSAQFMKLVNDSAFARKLGVPANSLEGYLFPETYSFYWGISPEEVCRLMVAEFFRQLPDSADIKARALGLTLHEIVTLASIIEGEAMVDSERTVISAVYHNRLKKGILLQADPTIQYIIPDGPRRLLKRDLQIDSPYNTYKYRGLPPGPVNNPGRKSLVAALHPADVPYLYFVARGDGSHIFSVTYAQHRRAKKAFDKIRREVRRKQLQNQRGKR